ncbi:uncharacterized protein [Haliotis asinina]|uniref:uncharacterized protein n=1 Tax=Haliotis asinina TaxID=109174 RepID=UPI0035323A86
MESSDEEFIIDIPPEPSANSSNDRKHEHGDTDDSKGNQKMGRLIFRETVGTDVKMITENCDVVDINTDQDALNMLTAGDKITDAHPFVTLTWTCLTNKPRSFFQVHLRAGSKTMNADIIFGLIENNYKRLRELTEKIHSIYRARVTYVQDNPFGFGLAHESTVNLDEIGSVIEDLERDVQIVLSACANRDISLELSLDLSDSSEPTYDECNTEADSTPVSTQPTNQTRSGGDSVLANTADNVDEIGCANEAGNRSTVVDSMDDSDIETERKFEDIEENVEAQRSVIEAKFEEQRAQNEEINTTLKMLMSFVQQKISRNQPQKGAAESPHPSGSNDLGTESDTHQASVSKEGQSDIGGREKDIVIMTEMNSVSSTKETEFDTLEQSVQNQKQDNTDQKSITYQHVEHENQQNMENPSGDIPLKLDEKLSEDRFGHPLSNVEISEVPRQEGPWNPDDRVYDVLFNRVSPLANSGKQEKHPSDTDAKRQEMPESSQSAAGGYRLDPKLIAVAQGSALIPTHDNKASASRNSRPQPQPQHRPSQVPGPQRRRAQDLLKIFGIGGSSPEVQRLIQTVELAMVDEIPMPPKAKALDTILCLDTSSSMGQKGLKEMKDIAFAFIDALDDIAVKHNIEENIAVVTFGGRSKIEHHLSNDYTSIRDKIDKLQLGGRSPLFEALMVCLCAINGRAYAVDLFGIRRLQPRVIIITDGKASDESEDGTGDVYKVDNKAKLLIIQLMQEFAAKNNETMFPRPWVWIPAGNADMSFLKSLADMGKGHYMVGGLSVIPKLSQYQRTQITVSKVLVYLQRHLLPESGDIRQDIEAIMGLLFGGMAEEYKTEVIESVMAKLEGKEGNGNEDQGADGFDDIVEVDSLPPLGTRVTRGPDWNWGNQDTEGPGTIINHHEGEGPFGGNLLYVQWDNGTCVEYMYGLDGRYEVWPAPDQPRLTASDMLIDVGCEVTRGPDWKDDCGCQDGGPGCVGVVIRKNDQGMVKVRWKQTCYIGAYRYGADGKLDLSLRDPGDILTELTRSYQRKLPTNIEEDTQVKVQQKGMWVWYWKDEIQQWQKYTEDQQKRLENQYQKRPNGSCLIQRRGQSYRVLFKDMVEEDLSNESRRQVKRTCADEK